MASHWVAMADVGTRPCEVCGRPRLDDDSPRIHKDDTVGGCPHCTYIAWLKQSIPLVVLLVVIGGSFLYSYLDDLGLFDLLNILKPFIVAAIFLISSIVLGYIIFRARRRPK